MRVDQIIAYHALQRPDSLALTLDTCSLSYAGLNSRACKIANTLLAEGVGVGDRVAILCENSIDHVILMLGAAKIGAVTVAINYRLAGPELQFVIDDREAKLLVVPDAKLIAPVAELALTHKPLLLGCVDHLPLQWRNWESWWQYSNAHEPESVTGAEHAFLQLYTSGTTGRPKGAVISHRNLLDLSYAGLVAAEQRLNIGDNELVMAPRFHKVVPDLDSQDFTTLKRINYGASPISEELLRQAMAVFGCDFQQSYGMTDTSGAVAQLTVADHRKALARRPELLASCGRQNAATCMRVVDDGGNPLPDGQLGEIAVMSSTVMLEYWKQPEQTAKAIREGWLHSGDMGYRDRDFNYFN